MLDWQQLRDKLIQGARACADLIKRRRREELPFALAALLIWIASSFSIWLPSELKEWVGTWHGLRIGQGLCWGVAVALVCYGGYRISLLVRDTTPPPPEVVAAPLIGPMAFTPEQGELFHKLGRQEELKKLLGWIQDDQVRLVVVMGASGAGKTSLLRAGLTHILSGKNIGYHYWEAVPTRAEERLLRTLQESWDGPPQGAAAAPEPPRGASPASLDDLVNPPGDLCRRHHVVVLDQFEQLSGRNVSRDPIFKLLRKVAREARPPHRVTWVVAFRREFRADWSDFMIPLQEEGFFPREMSLKLFSPDQARDVADCLVTEAGLSVHEKVVENLVESAKVDGDVSPVDLGIGLLMLGALHDRLKKTVTVDDYHFSGGAEGLLTGYIDEKIGTFSEEDRDKVLKALLALRDPETNQRIAEGKTCPELSELVGADKDRLRTQLDRLAQRDVRLLEVMVPEDGHELCYRLAHERLIPALHRLTGKLLAEVDQARDRFDRAFRSWANLDQGSAYLLRGRTLRLVERYQDQIPWGKDADLKQKFLDRSRRRRTRTRLGQAVAALFLAGAGWLGAHQIRDYNHKFYLESIGYPSGLYDDWQHQLHTLNLTAPIALQRSNWIYSHTIDSLGLVAEAETSDTSGLEALKRCPNLRELKLDLSRSRTDDLKPLADLKGLAQLSLDLRGGDLGPGALKPLADLKGLAQLSLVLSRVDLGPGALKPLADLKGLAQLSLVLADLDLGPDGLKPLASLGKLQTLSIRGATKEQRLSLQAIPGSLKSLEF